MNRLSVIICGLLFSTAAFTRNAVHWDFNMKKIWEGKYELYLRASAQEPWHTYSQLTPDGGPLPTKTSFTQSPLIKQEGRLKEKGELKTIHDNTFDVDVKYFMGNDDFVQLVHRKVNTKAKVSGTVEYMACNDKQCLSPNTVPFTIEIPWEKIFKRILV